MPTNVAPKIGHVVQYKAEVVVNGKPYNEVRAAVVTRVHPDNSDDGMNFLDLFTMYPTGQFHHFHVAGSKEPKAGCWNWIDD